MSRPTKQLKSLRNRIAAAFGHTRTDRVAGSGGPVYDACGASAVGGRESVSARGPAGRFGALATLAAGLGIVASLLLMSAAASAQDPCPNADKRWGPSQDLPDCRAYELVTPAVTNAQTPLAGHGNHSVVDASVTGQINSQQLTTSAASADGDHFQFMLANTSLAIGGTGISSTYMAERGVDGWSSTFTSPGKSESQIRVPQGATGNFEYQVYHALTQPGAPLDYSMPTGTNWTRQPDGSFRPLGEGTVPANPDTDGYDNGFADDFTYAQGYFSPDGEHQVIANNADANGDPDAVALTPDAPTDGTRAIYDRTPEGLKLVSVIPDTSTPDPDDETLPTQDAKFLGASKDGSVLAFRIGGNPGELYVRINNETTKLVTTGDLVSGTIFAGASSDTIFYYKNASGTAEAGTSGDLYAYDFITEQETPIATTGEARFVRVTDDGSRVFFLSDQQLDGANGLAGQPNLYVWDGSDVDFIATTRPADHDVNAQGGGSRRAGLDSWANDTSGGDRAVANGYTGNLNTTRATADGSVFAFISSADLTGQNPGLHFQIYRWEADSGALTCVSCPTDGSDTTGKSLLTDATDFSGTSNDIPNLSANGRTVFFETEQRLAPGDRDNVTSVYQWRDGELSLLSSGAGLRGDHIVGATPDGSQVFINTTDSLVPEPQERGVPAIYSVRVNGGFPIPETVPPCIGDECQDDPTDPPAGIDPGSGNDQAGNVQVDAKRCKKLENKADKASSKARKLKRKAAKAKKRHHKQRAKKLKRRAGNQKQKAKRYEARIGACWGGSK